MKAIGSTKNGEVKIKTESRERELQTVFKKMTQTLLPDGQEFTRGFLKTNFHLSNREVSQFFRFVREKDSGLTIKQIQSSKFQTWEGTIYRLIERITVVQAKYPVSYMAYSYSSRHGQKCDRYGMFIRGIGGRHNRSAFGHTKEICDVEMVKMIQVI